jgi:predicted RNA-binding Zn-ribbon protein involved in translation (DUF1610 family)
MPKERVRGFCPKCGHEQVFQKGEIHHGVHLLLSILTLGLWLVSWLAILIGHRLRPWYCPQCGWHTPLFHEPKVPSGKENV